MVITEVKKSTGYEITKRFLDIIFSLILLVIFSPVILFVAFAIKFSSSGPVFADTPARVGKDGKLFKMYKFRSMVQNAHEMLREDPEFAELYKAYKMGSYKLKNDPRITAVGHFIRTYSFDELPQFINILNGDMSLVGPRPTSFGPETYKLWHTERLDVAPGLTGLWQIIGRAQLEFDDRLRLDIAYIERRSLWLDSAILLYTLAAVFKQRGAH